MNILYFILFVCGVWSLWGYVSSRAETAAYSVVESRDGYEVRLYPEHIVARTVVTGSYNKALNEGFRIIAGYIFGGNTKKERIAMTTPVVEQSESSESIAMTTPVTATIQGTSHTISFGMPRSYTRATLPTPDDARIEIATIPEKKVAALRFSWVRTDTHVRAKKQQLLHMLARDGSTTVGEPYYAGYNAPWTPPWMTRNEVLIEIK